MNKIARAKHSTKDDVIDLLEVGYVSIIKPHHSSDVTRIVKPGEGQDHNDRTKDF